YLLDLLVRRLVVMELLQERVQVLKLVLDVGPARVQRVGKGEVVGLEGHLALEGFLPGILELVLDRLVLVELRHWSFPRERRLSSWTAARWTLAPRRGAGRATSSTGRRRRSASRRADPSRSRSASGRSPRGTA